MSSKSPVNPAIEIDDLSVAYRDRIALDGLSMRVEPGEWVALLGPNGSGKSTLFRILATQARPSSGRASILAHDVHRDAHRVRRSIGVVFQSPALDPMLTARENLTHHGRLFDILSRSELSDRVSHALHQIGLSQRAEDRVHTFSGGMKRRLEIAKAMLPAPPVLLLDEPDTGLDPDARAWLRQTLRELADVNGTTILLTTHQMDTADAAHRVALLRQGRLIAFDSVERLKQRVAPRQIVVRTDDARRSLEMLTRSTAIRGRIESDQLLVIEQGDANPSDLDLVARIVNTLGASVRALTLRAATLDDVYFALSGERVE
jgi:ABC-type multidrug transport system ATPase subunit